MKTRFTGLGCSLAVAALIFSGCSTLRELRKPAVAIVISLPGGAVPTTEQAASVYAAIRPEIERRGYTVAKSTYAADYYVLVTDPVDPLGATGGRVRFDRPPVEKPFGGSAAVAAREAKANSEKVFAEMVRDPK